MNLAGAENLLGICVPPRLDLDCSPRDARRTFRTAVPEPLPCMMQISSQPFANSFLQSLTQFDGIAPAAAGVVAVPR